jgi:membrane fusion protein, macrolide-specific efflux system
VVSKGSYVVKLPVGSSDINGVVVGQTATFTVTTSSSASSGGFPGGGFPGGIPGAGQGGGTGSGSGANGSGSARGGSSSAGGATATGKVTDVARVADTSSGVAKYPVTVAFTAGSGSFYVGSTVSGSVATETRDNVLQIPLQAVTPTNGRSTVVVAKDGTTSGRTETRTVTTGLTANGMVEIKSGLKDGDSVIVPSRTGLGGTGTGSGTNGGGTPGGGNFPGGGFPGTGQVGQGTG